MAVDMLWHEEEAWGKGFMTVAGVDEAGRGPICGPVVAAACVWPQGVPAGMIDDSKKLSEKKRELLYDVIMRDAVAVGVGIVDNHEIDRINILQATFKAMRLAVDGLHRRPDYLLVDGNRTIPGLERQKAVVKGDSCSVSIAAASIIAKVTRDRLMRELDELYPGYGLAQHKGYPSKGHYAAILRLGPSPAHRLTFAGVLAG